VPRYMQRDGQRRKLVVVVTSPDPASNKQVRHHVGQAVLTVAGEADDILVFCCVRACLCQPRPKGVAFLSELMPVDGSVYLVKAHLDGGQLTITFAHQIYQALEPKLVVVRQATHTPVHAMADPHLS
jgi:hypothetical protein